MRPPSEDTPRPCAPQPCARGWPWAGAVLTVRAVPADTWKRVLGALEVGGKDLLKGVHLRWRLKCHDKQVTGKSP